MGKDTGGGYISGTDRYDLRNHEAFTIIGGTSIRILFVVYSEPQQINTVCHFKEKDMEDLWGRESAFDKINMELEAKEYKTIISTE